MNTYSAKSLFPTVEVIDELAKAQQIGAIVATQRCLETQILANLAGSPESEKRKIRTLLEGSILRVSPSHILSLLEGSLMRCSSSNIKSLMEGIILRTAPVDIKPLLEGSLVRACEVNVEHVFQDVRTHL